jgi:hypothetical protein
VFKVILKLKNVANNVVDRALEIDSIVDLVKTDRQFVLQPIENAFCESLPRMARRAVDQTVPIDVSHVAHNAVFVCRQIVAQKGSLIRNWNVSDDVFQKSDSFADGGASFDLKVKPAITFLIAGCGHG